MARRYFDLAKQHVPPTLCRLVERFYEADYIRADELAEGEVESNRGHACGYLRWLKANDSLFRAAAIVGLPADRVKASNGQTHTEVYAGPFTLVTTKGDEPGYVNDAEYRSRLKELNATLDLFKDDPIQFVPLRKEEEKICAIIQHVPYMDDKRKLWGVWMVIPDEDGKPPIDFFRLDELHSAANDEGGGIENVPDNVGPTPIPAKRKAEGE